MDWFYLALLSALSLAFADAFSKKYFQGCTGLEMVLVRFLIPGVLLLPVTLLGEYPSFSSEFWLWIAVLIPLELIAMWLYWLAIRDSALHLTLPYLAFTPVFNVFTGDLILGESVTLQKLFGILLVVFGAYLLNIKKAVNGQRQSLWQPIKAILHERGSRLMLLAAIVYSITSVMGKGAALFVKPEIFGAFYFAIIGFVGLILVLVVKPDSFKVLSNKPWASLLVGFCLAVMVVSHFLSITQTEVAYMIAVKRTSLLFGIILGAVFFAEKQLSRHFIAGSIMVTGVAIILI